MDDLSKDIRKDLNEFQLALNKLRSGVSKASPLWKDQKYRELSESIRIFANSSKYVIESGDKCCKSLDRFLKIAEEEY